MALKPIELYNPSKGVYQMPENFHPLISVLQQYVSDHAKLRERHQDINDLTFNRKYGLHVKAPAHWPVIDAARTLIEWCQATGIYDKFLVIYPSTAIYNAISRDLHVSDVSYFAWHEMFVAMTRAGQDARFIKELKGRIEIADLVVFLGFSDALPEVVDQIRGLCPSCLILME